MDGSPTARAARCPYQAVQSAACAWCTAAPGGRTAAPSGKNSRALRRYSASARYAMTRRCDRAQLPWAEKAITAINEANCSVKPTGSSGAGPKEAT